jgi:hypothetical protein
LTEKLFIDILSIDSDNRGGAIIGFSVQSHKKDIMAFLEEMNAIFQDPGFQCSRDLTIIKAKKSAEKEVYSTSYTLLDLDYNSEDVMEKLKELTFHDYSETLVDRDDLNPPFLFVFGKDINGRQVYIKLKIKGDRLRHILCVSFHYAEYEMQLPFA